MASPGVVLPPTVEQLQTAFDNSIWYRLSLWPALHVAVDNSWGGPDSADKRDWFAGAVSDLLNQRLRAGTGTDPDELEAFLLQIMQDEFDCNVEDESEIEVARDILGVWKRMLEERSLDAAKEVEQRWKNRGQVKTNQIQVSEVNQEVDDDDEWDGFEEEEDVEMGEPEEAPRLVPATIKEKEDPEVDDDGFTKVAGKRRAR